MQLITTDNIAFPTQKQQLALQWSAALCNQLGDLHEAQNTLDDDALKKIMALGKIMELIVLRSKHLSFPEIKEKYMPQVSLFLGNNNRIIATEFMNIAMDAVIDERTRLLSN